MDRYVIDADGNLLPGDVDRLRRLLKSNAPEPILREHAVNHAGFVLIDHDGDRANIFMQVDDDSRPLTRVELFAWLNRSSAKSVIVYDNGHTPILQSRAKVIERLQMLPPFCRVRRNRFRSRPIDAERSLLAPLVRAFLDVVAGFRSVHDVETICNQMFQGRYTISRLAGDGSTLVIQSLGHGYWSFDPIWTSMARGCRPQDGPDYHYGLWVADTHGRALRINRLLFDDVDAVIGRPRLPAMRVTYTRCVVPFRLRRGPCYVLSASAARDDIDLLS